MDAPVFPIISDDGGHRLAMLAARVYRIQPGLRPCTPLRADAPEDELDPFCALKPATDVLLRGAVHSCRGPAQRIDTAIQVGTFRRDVRAWGPRTIELGARGEPRFSEPHPVATVPLAWEQAYGGRDPHAERKLQPPRSWNGRAEEPKSVVTYPRNSVGRGFFLDMERERIAGTPAPCLEDPRDPVTPDRILARSPLDWMDRPVAACYDSVDMLTFPRLAFWLGAEHETPARPLHELRQGVLRAADLSERSIGTPADPRVYNCSAAGFAGMRLHGNERVALWNLHPKHEAMEFLLPAERPRFLLEPPACGIHELPPLLQTVLIEPEEDRITLTWAGTLEVAAPYPEEMCQRMRRAVRWQS